jgi:hypothetical protein
MMMSFNQDLKKIMILYPEFEVTSQEDFRDLVNIHNVAEFVFGQEPDAKLVESAFNNRGLIKLNNLNDYYFLIFKSARSYEKIKKLAYPNVSNIEIDEEFNLDKWAGLVHKIYDAVSSGDMSLHTAINYYADTLDKGKNEGESFKRWVHYYNSGDHKKYSDLKKSFKKDAFQFPLSGPGFYGPENAIVPEQNLSKSDSSKNKGDDYAEWKNKLYSAIRRIDKLLRQGDDMVDSDVAKDLSDLLHQFDQEVRALRIKTTAADLAYHYAQKFKKKGFDNGYNEFIKYAQEIDKQLIPTIEDTNLPSPAKEGLSAQPNVEKNVEPLADESLEEKNTGAKEGEYEKLEGDVNLGDAVDKLEEIAGRLSDRRTIRLLAEFDIILDKIGIAPMFPELAEAQSKLIDGYSYALTRVTKMLGMLSSGKSLIEISNAKKKDLTEKTMKEVNKSFFEEENENEDDGSKSIQEGLDSTIEQQPQAPLSPVAQEVSPAPAI